MVVINISGKDLPIKEIKRIIPADGKKYCLPYKLAIQYKKYLKPIQLSDEPPKDDKKEVKISKEKKEEISNKKDEKKSKKEIKKESLKNKVDKSPDLVEENKINLNDCTREKLGLEKVNSKKEIVINIWKEGLVKSKKEISRLTDIPYQNVVYYIKKYEKKKKS